MIESTIMAPYYNANNIMKEAVKSCINENMSTQFRILGSDRNGNFRTASNPVNDGCDYARTGDVDTMVSLGIPLNHPSGVWLAVNCRQANNANYNAYVFNLPSGDWYPNASQIAHVQTSNGSASGYSHTYEVVPIFDLKPETKINGGTGTFDNPWIIVDE